MQHGQASSTLPERLTLTIDYEGTTFVGVLAPDAIDWLPTLLTHLHARLGRTIQEIGNEEVEL